MNNQNKNVADLIGRAAEVSESEAAAPANSEEQLALLFGDRHAADARYVAAWNRWLRFDGTRWDFDNTRKIFSDARKLCRERATQTNNPSAGKSIASAKTRAAVVSLAGEDRRLAATVDQWDADPWLLNTPAGVIDLCSGKRRDPRPEDYMTKITAVAPDASCRIPLWSKFLATVTNNDKELQTFLARVCGYALTGSISEHALFFLHGQGANGKSVFINTVTGIFGDYHRTAPIETFTATNVDRHPTELAGLRGARMVTAVETEEGRRWAEARVKSLTGGDRVAARFMRQDFFEYVPQFKLLIAGNHKPGLRSVDEAIRRRFNLVPFAVTIPLGERDKDLGDKLRAEWSGILSWMIEGCKQWQKKSLAPPKAVTDATDEYLKAEDALLLWIDECCRKGPDEWTEVGILFASWTEYADAMGEFVGSAKRFSQRLEAHGYTPLRSDQRGFRGLTVFKEQTTQESGQKLQKQKIWSPPF
jgi:putative DNA primase/helicase